jgi:hypothetical protein
MATTLFTSNIWRTLSTAAHRRTRSAVAVAYFGQGAAKLLPLRKGSRLVVDASDAAVASGQTCPAELQKLLRRGVRIYTRTNLHAKVFVFGTQAFVGSTNVSDRSARMLREAVVATSDRKVVRTARKFVHGLCMQDLGPEALARLQKIYRPPRVPGAGRRGTAANVKGREGDIPPMRMAQIIVEDPPKESGEAQKEAQAASKKRMKNPRRHVLDEFWWPGGDSPFAPGDMVVQVVDEGRGQHMVSPPGTVVHKRNWANKSQRATFVFLEKPKRNRMSLKRLAKRLGRGALKRLLRAGRVNRNFVDRLLAAWQE